MSIVVTELYIYPVKGLGGLELDSAIITRTGLEYDRHWMIVMPNGRMVTQRQIPQLAAISTALTADTLELMAPGHPSLLLDLHELPSSRVHVSVWRDSFEAGIEERAHAWLNRVIDFSKPLRLVRSLPDSVRTQSKPELLGEFTTTEFADAAPVLTANESSLYQLNDVLGSKDRKPVPMNRFRPNIVVQGLAPFAEYNQSTLTSDGGVEIELCYPSERCIVTTIDQLTGKADAAFGEPLATLIEMNTNPATQGAYFGQNSIVRGFGSEKIHCGMKFNLN